MKTRTMLRWFWWSVAGKLDVLPRVPVREQPVDFSFLHIEMSVAFFMRQWRTSDAATVVEIISLRPT